MTIHRSCGQDHRPFTPCPGVTPIGYDAEGAPRYEHTDLDDRYSALIGQLVDGFVIDTGTSTLLWTENAGLRFEYLAVLTALVARETTREHVLAIVE